MSCAGVQHVNMLDDGVPEVVCIAGHTALNSRMQSIVALSLRTPTSVLVAFTHFHPRKFHTVCVVMHTF